MATLTEQASKLLDFNQKLDITLLDNVVGCMYTGIGEQVSLETRLQDDNLFVLNPTDYFFCFCIVAKGGARGLDHAKRASGCLDES